MRKSLSLSFFFGYRYVLPHDQSPLLTLAETGNTQHLSTTIIQHASLFLAVVMLLPILCTLLFPIAKCLRLKLISRNYYYFFFIFCNDLLIKIWPSWLVNNYCCHQRLIRVWNNITLSLSILLVVYWFYSFCCKKIKNHNCPNFIWYIALYCIIR